MLKEISQKLTMKKTLFTTQLENFFNAISQEYQEAIRQLELEKQTLQDSVAKLERDVENLVKIKKSYESSQELTENHHATYVQTIEKLEKENQILKEELEKMKSQTETDESVDELKAQVKKLQGYLAKGISAYHDTIQRQKTEDLVKEINQTLKK